MKKHTSILIILLTHFVLFSCSGNEKKDDANEDEAAADFTIKSEEKSVFVIDPSELKPSYSSQDSLLIDYAKLIVNNMSETGKNDYDESKTFIKFCPKTKQYYVRLNVGRARSHMVKFRQIGEKETDYRSYETIAAMHDDVFNDWEDCGL